jgi:uncharacterized repeat protein (TIGR03803 family)
MARRVLAVWAVVASLSATAGGIARAENPPLDDGAPAVTTIDEEAAPEIAHDASPSLATLYAFAGGDAGRHPESGLVADKEGNFYGTASGGGRCDGCGLVYMLSPSQDGAGWTYRVLHHFAGGEADGSAPVGTLTVRGNALYGTTAAGGSACDCGTVFRLKPLDRARTRWDYSLLHRFQDRNRGARPLAGLIFGEDGALYGTTSAGGADDSGTIFRMKGGADAGWQLTVLHHFLAARDGGAPRGELVFGEKRMLFGTASGGGRFGEGTVFRLNRNGAYSVVHHFKGTHQPGRDTDGATPQGHLAVGDDGALYGTTARGGDHDVGTIYRLRPTGEGKWVYSVIHHFAGGGDDGSSPRGGLTIESGSLYGTANGGGAEDGGIVYRVTRAAEGWGIEILHAFARNRDGALPHSNLTVRNGALYGTTFVGGSDRRSEACPEGCGSVFTLDPT